MLPETARKDDGFTLIELLVVMIIIGVLAAIAIPLFLNQRTKGYEATAKSDAQAIATDVASAVIDGAPATAVTVAATPASPATSVTQLTTAIGTSTLGSKISAYDQVKIYVDTAGAYCVSAKNSQGGASWGFTGGTSTSGGLAKGTCTSSTVIS
jgi:type IV pilus assembly protein PilA